MKGPALSAMALAAVAGAANAGATDTPNDYVSLDRELDSLASTLAPAEGGVKVGAWIKTNIISQDGTGGAADTLGAQANGIRISFSGDVAPGYKLKISVDAAKGQADLKDAYGVVKLCEEADLTLGNFKSPFSFSGTTADEKLLFYTRTAEGAVWTDRDLGAMFSGAMQNFRWAAAFQNGGDGIADKQTITGKVNWDMVAGKGFAKQEGGFGPNAETQLTVGVGYLDEGSISKGGVLGLDAVCTSGPFYAQAEIADYDKDFTAGAVGGGAAKKASGHGDTTPFGIQAAYAFNENWEAAVRFDDQDDADDTSTIGAGINYYVKGHDCKWQLDVLSTSSDQDALDTDTILLGLTIVV
jgi:hypothetical protein